MGHEWMARKQTDALYTWNDGKQRGPTSQRRGSIAQPEYSLHVESTPNSPHNLVASPQDVQIRRRPVAEETSRVLHVWILLKIPNGKNKIHYIGG